MKPASLRARLRWLIIFVLIAVLLPLSLYSYRRTIAEVGELSDARLSQAARTLDVLTEHTGRDSLQRDNGKEVIVPSESNDPDLASAERDTFESEVGFQIFDLSGRIILATANLAALPPPRAGDADFQDIEQDGYSWRVFTLLDKTDGVLIRAGERYDSRNDIARALWLDHGLPLLVGLPLLALLADWTVRRGLRPLESLAQAVSARESGRRAPVLLVDAPVETQPVLDALNDQIERIEAALERERRFSADVAHELRTPLASTMINLENALATPDRAGADTGFLAAQHSLAALARRVEQLLALARLESGVASDDRAVVDLVALAIEVIEELAPVIAESGVELGFTHSREHIPVSGYEAALAALLHNLIENATRNVPAGGRVQLSITHGAEGIELDVFDDGPGIPLQRRADVFARFHREASSRGDGYGLGLSIVQRAAQLHGTTIALLDSLFGRGLKVSVVLPARPTGSVSETC